MRGLTLAQICGERWARLLCPTHAAAYCGMLLPEFRRSRFYHLRHTDGDKEFYDRDELDGAIQDYCQQTKGEK